MGRQGYRRDAVQSSEFEDGESRDPACASRPSENRIGKSRAPTIGVVDDDDSTRRALQRLLAASGFRVETFASAEEFLASDRREWPDCLVLDVQLGGISGFALQAQLLAAGARTPIVFITAHDDAATRERARQAGAADYLRKPFDGEALIGAINRAIGRA